eukprot:s5000_g1.t1
MCRQGITLADINSPAHPITMTLSEPDGEHIGVAFLDVSQFSAEENFQEMSVELLTAAGVVAVVTLFTARQNRWAYEAVVPTTGAFIEWEKDPQAKMLYDHMMSQDLGQDAAAEEEKPAETKPDKKEQQEAERRKEAREGFQGQPPSFTFAQSISQEQRQREAEAAERKRQEEANRCWTGPPVRAFLHSAIAKWWFKGKKAHYASVAQFLRNQHMDDRVIYITGTGAQLQHKKNSRVNVALADAQVRHSDAMNLDICNDEAVEAPQRAYQVKPGRHWENCCLKTVGHLWRAERPGSAPWEQDHLITMLEERHLQVMKRFDDQHELLSKVLCSSSPATATYVPAVAPVMSESEVGSHQGEIREVAPNDAACAADTLRGPGRNRTTDVRHALPAPSGAKQPHLQCQAKPDGRDQEVVAPWCKTSSNIEVVTNTFP